MPWLTAWQQKKQQQQQQVGIAVGEVPIFPVIKTLWHSHRQWHLMQKHPPCEGGESKWGASQYLIQTQTLCRSSQIPYNCRPASSLLPIPSLSLFKSSSVLLRRNSGASSGRRRRRRRRTGGGSQRSNCLSSGKSENKQLIFRALVCFFFFFFFPLLQLCIVLLLLF